MGGIYYIKRKTNLSNYQCHGFTTSLNLPQTSHSNYLSNESKQDANGNINGKKWTSYNALPEFYISMYNGAYGFDAGILCSGNNTFRWFIFGTNGIIYGSSLSVNPGTSVILSADVLGAANKIRFSIKQGNNFLVNGEYSIPASVYNALRLGAEVHRCIVIAANENAEQDPGKGTACEFSYTSMYTGLMVLTNGSTTSMISTVETVKTDYGDGKPWGIPKNGVFNQDYYYSAGSVDVAWAIYG